jgi:hypothetical protein
VIDYVKPLNFSIEWNSAQHRVFKEQLRHILYNQTLAGQLGNLSTGLPSFCTGTIHKFGACQTEFDGDFCWHLSVESVGWYSLELHKQRVADKAFHERIAGQAIEQFLAVACTYIEYARH